MKAFSSLRVCLPLLGFGAILLLAPASRAQEVSPDHFDENGVVAVVPAKAPAKSKQLAAHTAQPQNKNSAKASQVAANKSSAAPQPALLAVTDKRKSPARKPNNQ